MAAAGRLDEVVQAQFPRLVHPEHRDDARLREILRQMAQDVGAEAFARQQRATMDRADSRPGLEAIHVPTLVRVGEGDPLTPAEQATFELTPADAS